MQHSRAVQMRCAQGLPGSLQMRLPLPPQHLHLAPAWRAPRQQHVSCWQAGGTAARRTRQQPCCACWDPARQSTELPCPSWWQAQQGAPWQVPAPPRCRRRCSGGLAYSPSELTFMPDRLSAFCVAEYEQLWQGLQHVHPQARNSSSKSRLGLQQR